VTMDRMFCSLLLNRKQRRQPHFVAYRILRGGLYQKYHVIIILCINYIIMYALMIILQ